MFYSNDAYAQLYGIPSNILGTAISSMSRMYGPTRRIATPEEILQMYSMQQPTPGQGTWLSDTPVMQPPPVAQAPYGPQPTTPPPAPPPVSFPAAPAPAPQAYVPAAPPPTPAQPSAPPPAYAPQPTAPAGDTLLASMTGGSIRRRAPADPAPVASGSIRRRPAATSVSPNAYTVPQETEAMGALSGVTSLSPYSDAGALQSVTSMAPTTNWTGQPIRRRSNR